MILLFAHDIGSGAGYNVMDQVMIPDAGAPLVKWVAFLETDIINRQGDQSPFRYFVGIFVILVHPKPPL